MDDDGFVEEFYFSYNVEGEGLNHYVHVNFQYDGGTSLYVDGGVVDAFCQFLRGSGYFPDELEEALRQVKCQHT